MASDKWVGHQSNSDVKTSKTRHTITQHQQTITSTTAVQNPTQQQQKQDAAPLQQQQTTAAAKELVKKYSLDRD